HTLRQAPPGSEPARRYLEELVKIDLGHRWRKSGPSTAGPCVEEYAARFPHLVRSTELVAEEYRARQLWGDRPRHDAYIGRFPELARQLREVLPEIDREISAELRPSSPRAAQPAAPSFFSPSHHPELVQPVISVQALVDALRRLPLLRP